MTNRAAILIDMVCGLMELRTVPCIENPTLYRKETKSLGSNRNNQDRRETRREEKRDVEKLENHF